VPSLNKFQINPNLIQTHPNLLWSKQDFPLLQKFELKYGCKVFELRNNFSYKDFLRLELDFDLKFREASMS
jgi:hypothetical protein